MRVQQSLFSSLFLKASFSVVLCLLPFVSAMAADTVPRTLDYRGTVLGSEGEPLSEPLVFRFSLWADSDFNSFDRELSGELNLENESFSGYEEVQQVSPDRVGQFNTSIGLVNPLPDLDFSIHKYLQVEVKQIGAPDSSYEVLDIDSDISNLNDRKLLSAAPYAISADSLDSSDIGYEAGDIPVLNSEGKINSNAMADEINEAIFTIGASDTESDLRLNFGKTDAKSIKWAQEKERFEIGAAAFVWGNLANTGNTVLGDDIEDVTSVSGDLFITGTINGEDVNQISQNRESIDINIAEIISLDAEINDVSTKIFNLEEKTQAFRNYDAEIQSLETISSDHLTAIDKNITDIAYLKSQIEENTNKIKEEQSVDLLNKSDLESEVKARQEALSVLRKELSDKMTDLVKTARENANKRMDDSDSKLSDRITKLRENLIKRLDRLDENSKSRDENLKIRENKMKSELVNSIDKKVSALKNSDSKSSNNLSNKISKVNTDLSNHINKVKSQLTNNINEQKSKVDDKIKTLSSNKDNKISNLRSDLVNRMDSTNSNLKNKINKLKSELEDKIKNSRSQSSDKDKALDQKLSSEISSLKDFVRSEIKKLRERTGKSLESQVSKLEEKVKSAQKQANDNRDALRKSEKEVEKLSKQISSLKSKQIEKIEADLKSLFSSLKEQNKRINQLEK